MTLQEQLQAIKAKSVGKFTPEVLSAMKQGFAELQNSMAREQALRVNAKAPVFALPNTRGEIIDSRTLLVSGPLVVLFYRGKW